ncbi:MAG TPA: hypothetical protein VG738_02550 [Chitinophagaceae bacterium]|nr:hypothetical protein [Chitinophagaceae bacterium]
MKKLVSIRYNARAFNLAMLRIRLAFGTNMLFIHGLYKLQKFNSL